MRLCHKFVLCLRARACGNCESQTVFKIEFSRLLDHLNDLVRTLSATSPTAAGIVTNNVTFPFRKSILTKKSVESV